MKTSIQLFAVLLCSFASPAFLKAQGYLVPNGVSYAGLNFLGGYEIDVIHDPVNSNTTGFYFTPQGSDTFQFDSIVDVGARVFFLTSGQPVSLPAIQAGQYTELLYPNSYTLADGSAFYVGLYTGNDMFAPTNGIYENPLFGWALLKNNQGAIELLDGALAYEAGGIYAGTQTLIPVPEPSALALLLNVSVMWVGRRRMLK